MEPINLNPKEDAEHKRFAEHIFENALGNPIVFSDVPVLADMKSNTWGKNGTDVYIKFADGNGIKLTGSSF